MNFRTKRFIETTLPMIILFGIMVCAATWVNIWFGLIAILLFAGVDVIMLRKKE